MIEQITYLLFIRRLDDLHTLEENKSARTKKPMARRVFPEGKDGIGKGGGRSYEDLRWSRFKHFAPADMYRVVIPRGGGARVRSEEHQSSDPSQSAGPGSSAGAAN